jgi:hypothetical protein
MPIKVDIVNRFPIKYERICPWLVSSFPRNLNCSRQQNQGNLRKEN